MGYVLVGIVVFLSILYYHNFVKVQSRKSISPKKQHTFSVDVENPIICSYVANMYKQHKFNSRLLCGSGKTHCVEELVEGSLVIKSKNISVIKILGDRFS